MEICLCCLIIIFYKKYNLIQTDISRWRGQFSARYETAFGPVQASGCRTYFRIAARSPIPATKTTFNSDELSASFQVH